MFIPDSPVKREKEGPTIHPRPDAYGPFMLTVFIIIVLITMTISR